MSGRRVLDGPQMSLDLTFRPALGREDFLVVPSNALAVGMIDRWPDWPGRALLIAGPEGSGKSHLAAVWAARAAPPHETVEDADRALGCGLDEIALMRRLDRAAAGGGDLLITARAVPRDWPGVRPDLRTRLAAMMLAELGPPDDQLLEGLIARAAAARGLKLAPPVIAYIAPRIARSAAAAREAVALLDRAALSHGQRISLAFVRRVLGGIAERVEDGDRT